MEDEGVLFEGLRLGSLQAFEQVVRADGAAMRRLARLYVPEDRVGELLAQSWSVALPGLDMFTWHTTLRAWLTGILVTYGRARCTAPDLPDLPPPPGREAPPGGEPVPWATLGWSGLWGPEGWAVLEDTLARLPLPEREVLWLSDVEGWPWREVLDALGLTAEQGDELLLQGRSHLGRVVVAHLGAGPAGAVDTAERLEGVAHLLGALRPAPAPTPTAAPVDPGLVRAFISWRRRRGVPAWRRWRWELGRRLRRA